MRCFKDKIIFNFLSFEEIALRERKFPGTGQKTLEVQLTLGCKDEKDKCYWKSELLWRHSLHSYSKMLVLESFLTMALLTKFFTVKKGFSFTLFKILKQKKHFRVRFSNNILTAFSEFCFSCFQINICSVCVFYCLNILQIRRPFLTSHVQRQKMDKIYFSSVNSSREEELSLDTLKVD